MTVCTQPNSRCFSFPPRYPCFCLFWKLTENIDAGSVFRVGKKAGKKMLIAGAKFSASLKGLLLNIELKQVEFLKRIFVTSFYPLKQCFQHGSNSHYSKTDGSISLSCVHKLESAQLC